VCIAWKIPVRRVGRIFEREGDDEVKGKAGIKKERGHQAPLFYVTLS